MRDLLPDFEDREEMVALLLLAEVLTRRGEIGPLARIVACRPKPAAAPIRPPEPEPDRTG